MAMSILLICLTATPASNHPVTLFINFLKSLRVIPEAVDELCEQSTQRKLENFCLTFKNNPHP